MTYLVLQMIGGLLVAAVFGALLLWLGQVLWGRLVAPVRAKTLQYELEEARTDLVTQGERIEALQKELSGSTEKVEALERAKRQLTATLDARNRTMKALNERVSAVDLEARPSSRESAEDLRRELRIAVQERDDAQATLRHEVHACRPSSKCCTEFTSECSTTSSDSRVGFGMRSSR